MNMLFKPFNILMNFCHLNYRTYLCLLVINSMTRVKLLRNVATCTNLTYKYKRIMKNGKLEIQARLSQAKQSLHSKVRTENFKRLQ